MISTNTLFVVQILVDLIMPFTLDLFTGETVSIETILCFGFLLIFNNLLGVEYSRATVREGNNSEILFHEKALIRYSELSQSNREGVTVETFISVLSKKENAIITRSWHKSSLKYAMRLIISLLSTIWIINSILPLIYMVIMYIIVYPRIVTQMTKAKDLRISNRNLLTRTSKQNNFQYKKIRIGQGNIPEIIARNQKLVEISSEIEWEWTKLSLLCSIPIIISIVLSLLTCKCKPINLAILCTTMLGSISTIASFFNSYEDMVAKEDQYEEYWKDKIAAQLPKQFSIPEVTKIVEYSFNGQTMWFNKPADIKVGKIIRLTGSTGAGKTTFINALKGVSKGLVLEDRNPLNYFNSISHLRQDIREAYHFSDITLSELFGNTSEETITEILDIVGMREWYKGIGSIHNDINNNISGGEKTKLCLGITILEGVNRQLIILDEPEQGLDAEAIPIIFNKVFKWLHMRNPRLRIIFISHICECIVKNLPQHDHWHITRNSDGLKMIIT